MAKFILKRKHNSNQEQWEEAVATIESLVSKEELDVLIEKTVEDIRRKTDGLNAAYAWSGGKDSIILAELCKLANIEKSMIGLTKLEYPAFVEWINENKPDGCLVMTTEHDLQWLANHQEALFPPMTYHWSRFVQIATQESYYKSEKLDMLILGRRKADGNFVGRGTNIYTDGRGRVKYNPISDWKHEHILAYIHYYNLPVPPIYKWDEGYKYGTHPWFARPYVDITQEGWGQIYKIDPEIVNEAAQYISSAKTYLEGQANANN